MSKFLKQYIERRMDQYHEFIMNKNYIRGFWIFYDAYNIALSYLGRTDIDADHKNYLFRQYLRNPQATDSRIFKSLMAFTESDKTVIYDCLELIAKRREEESFEEGDLDRPFCIAVEAYQYPQEDEND